MEKTTIEEEKKKEAGILPWYRPLLFFLIFIILGSSGLLIYHGVTGYYPWDKRSNSILSAGMSDDQTVRALQEATDRSAFTFRINSRPEFADSTAAGPLFIENPDTNRYLMRVTIQLYETGEVIYKTAAIKPGQGIGQDKLLKHLKPGEHKALAVIMALNPDTGETAGSAQAEMKLIIKRKGEE